jgi:hypothetical protein
VDNRRQASDGPVEEPDSISYISVPTSHWFRQKCSFSDTVKSTGYFQLIAIERITGVVASWHSSCFINDDSLSRNIRRLCAEAEE